MSKRGIVIVNTGSPDNPSPEAVGEYLERFLSHPRIVPMNEKAWSIIRRLFIIPSRSKESAKKYEVIWTDEGFTFTRDHDLLAKKVARALAGRGEKAAVAFAMSFGKPDIETVLGKLRDAGCDSLAVLPLYPQNAYSQAYIVADQVRDALASLEWDVDCAIIGDYSTNETYLKALADSIRDAGFDPSRGDRLLMAFHSIPRVDVENGDTYAATTKATCLALARSLSIPDKQWVQGFQSRFDKGRKWLDPFVPQILEAWAKEGFDGRLFFVCPNFSVDCLETHYDVELVLRFKWYELLEKNDIDLFDDSFVYVPCLGASDAHVEVILDVLEHPTSYL